MRGEHPLPIVDDGPRGGGGGDQRPARRLRLLAEFFGSWERIFQGQAEWLAWES